MRKLEPPSALQADLREQIRQLHSYLYRLQEQLNACLQELEDRLDESRKE